MTKLKDVQDAFQVCLLAGDDDATMITLIGEGAREKRQILLGVYKNAYRARLGEVLGNDYPQLHAYLGDEQFKAMALTYIDGHPSQTRSARWFGDALPAFLSAESPWKDRREIAELAALERALYAVFDAPDEVALAMGDFAEIAPEDWPALVFAPISATRRLTMRSNAADIWIALRDEIDPPTAALVEPTPLLTFRQAFQSRFRQIDGEEAMMWDEMSRGATFGELCVFVATYGGEEGSAERAAGYLGSWLSSGLLVRRF